MATMTLEKRDPALASTDQDAASFLARAAALRELVKSEAAKPENAARTSPAVVEAFRTAGFYWMLIPQSLGGSDRGACDFAAVSEEISSADPSAGWTLAAQGIATMVAGNFCTDDHVARMFGGARLPIMTATYAPTGKAAQEGETFVGSGRYSFGSGIAHADWVASALVIHENGQPVMQPDGKPRVVGAFLPADRVRALGNWDVVGMRATGSFDYELPTQTIPASWTFNQYWTEPKRRSRAATMGTIVAVCAGHTGVALGIARRSLHETARTASQKKRLYASASISDTSVFQLEFARMEALFQAARTRALQVFAAADGKAEAGEGLTEAEIQRIRQVTTWTHQVCRDVAVFAYGAVSSSLREPSILARNMLDVAVAAQHFIANDMSMIDAAPSIIDEWAEISAQSIG